MSIPTFFDLKEATLNNNCPECYANDGLTLLFKQKSIDNLFYSANSSQTQHKIYCTNCNTQIHPISWTEDIEQVVNYHTRALKIKPKSIKLKPLAWVFIIIDLILLIIVILFMTGVLSI